MSPTEKISRFACELTYDNLPEKAIDWARNAILDCTGVTLAGAKEEGGEIITGYVRETAGTPEAGVLGAGFKTNCGDAALANGTMAHALDYDDYVLPNWTGHPTAPILPAIFALGQKHHISGRDLLLAYVVGFEVGARFGACLGRGHYEGGWHPTATYGTMGATGACANILKLSVDQTRAAFGIAGSEASGIRKNFGTMTKPFHAGLSARNGVLAAQLAARGFTADSDVIEGPSGFTSVFTGQGYFDVDQALESLGDVFFIAQHGISIKPYPCCAEAHRCLDAMLHLLKEHGFKADEVESVVCRTSDIVPNIMLRHRPQNVEEAKFSMEYCLAVALLDGEVGLPQFTHERVVEPKVQELLTRVAYHHPPEASGYSGLERFPEQVTVKLHNGQTFSHEVLTNKGKPENRLSEAELVAKYRACAQGVISPEQTDQSLEMLGRLEETSDISDLLDVLCLTGR